MPYVTRAEYIRKYRDLLQENARLKTRIKEADYLIEELDDDLNWAYDRMDMDGDVEQERDELKEKLDYKEAVINELDAENGLLWKEVLNHGSELRKAKKERDCCLDALDNQTQAIENYERVIESYKVVIESYKRIVKNHEVTISHWKKTVCYYMETVRILKETIGDYKKRNWFSKLIGR